MNATFGVVILAAGASSRPGRPKQLLPYLGKTLVEHAARTALASGAQEVVVVVGADGDAIREKLKNLPVRVVFNREWADGMGGSVSRGIAALSQNVQCAVVALCDQPKITPDLLRRLAQRHFETGSQIVASQYDGVAGAPSAFGAELFPALMALSGIVGARDLIRSTVGPVEKLEFDGGNVDVERPCELWRRIVAPQAVAPRDVFREPQAARGPPSISLRDLSPA